MSAAHKQATGEPSTSPGSQSSSSPALATSFPSFSLLPPEIANRILTLACRSPEPSCKDAKEAKRRSPLSLDVATTLSLTLVSRAVSKVATTVLWETIRITKPSALLELYAAVREKPELAERIEHLHAGAEVMMPASEWPLSISYSDWSIHGGPMLSLSASFKGGDAAQRLPQGIIYGLPWPVQPQQKRLSDSREVAIGAAIEAALECINLDPYKRGYGLSGANIGLELWATRHFELQAVFDLYLAELRRIEDVHDDLKPDWRTAKFPRGASSNHPPYPRLVITGFSSAYSQGAAAAAVKEEGQAGDILVLTRAQLWQHLTRRGAGLDHFDHPILFARAGLSTATINAYGQALINAYLAGPYRNRFNVDGEDVAGPNAQQQGHPASDEANIVEALNLAPRNTVRALTIVITDIVAISVNLASLSLVGSLDSCLSIPVPTYRTLRSLSLGPLLPIWKTRGLFASRTGEMSALENLRVCGAVIDVEEARQVAGAEGCFPKLKRFQWELVESRRPYKKVATISAERLISLIRHLQGPLVNSNDDAALQLQLPSRLIEVRLHPKTCKDIFALLPKETRKAWKANKRLEENGKIATHRIRITESDAAKTSENENHIGVRKLRSNARKWFEDCVAITKDPSLDKGEDWMPSSSGGYSMAPRRKVKFSSEAPDEVEMHPDGQGMSIMSVLKVGYETESEGEGEQILDWGRICGERDD